MKEKPSPKSKSGLGQESQTGKTDKASKSVWKRKWEIIWEYYGDDSEEACLAFIDEFRRSFPNASKKYSDDQILLFGHGLDGDRLENG